MTDTITHTPDTSPTHDADGALVGGLAALVVLCILMMVLIGEVIPPVVVFVLVFAGLAVGLRQRPARWMRWTAGVAAALLVLANLPFAISDLSHPESVGGFVPTLLVIGTAITTAVLGIRAALGRRASGRTVWSIAGGLMLAGIVTSGVVSASVADDVAQSGDVAVEAVDVEFPATVEVPAESSALFVTNADPFRHTLLVEGTDVKVELPGSTARRVELGDLAPGTYRYWCDVPGHTSMEGTLRIG